MEQSFWLNRWERKEIGFHAPKPNPLLATYFDALQIREGSRVFLPLCGKTLDIGWLLDQGFDVVGVELSPIAVEELFAELNAQPVISEVGPFKRYSAPKLEIFLGDIFALTKDSLGAVNAVYDRAALIAMPDHMRIQYTQHLSQITGYAPQFLITLEYDPSVFSGPPFSIDEDEVSRLYGDDFEIKHRASEKISGGLKGKYPATDHVFHLTRK